MNLEFKNTTFTLRLCLLLAGFCILLNILFIGLQYLGDLTPKEQAVFRIQEGIDHQNIMPEDYPILRYGLQSTHTLVGLDQYTDCNIVYLMSMYRGEDRLKNAIVPGIAEPEQKLKASTRMCERAIGIATGKIKQDQHATETKARLWHGAKAVFLLLAPTLDIFQMRMLLQQITYLLYFLIGALFALSGSYQFLTFLPYGVFGILFSGVPFFNDLSNGLPHMVCLLCIANVLIVSRRKHSFQKLSIILTVFGSFHAFFFVTDGAEMLILPLLPLTLYFTCFPTLNRRQRFLNAMMLLMVYLIALAGSLVLKQIFSIAVLGFKEVYNEFIDAVLLRLSGQESGGEHIAIARTLEVLFGYYLNEIFYIRQLYTPLLYSSMFAWTLGLSILVFRLIEGKAKKHCFDASLFVLAGGAVIARYVIMLNHSFVHASLMARYLFVFFASGWALLIFLVQSRRHPETKNIVENRVQKPSPS